MIRVGQLDACNSQTAPLEAGRVNQRYQIAETANAHAIVALDVQDLLARANGTEAIWARQRDK